MAKQDRAVRTRQELIRSAAETFLQGGFALASLNGISARSGVSTGALHFHFRSKRELGQAVEEKAASTLRQLLTAASRGGSPSLARLAETSQRLADLLVDDVVLRAGFCLGVDATWHSESLLWEIWRDWVRSVLVRARHEGRLAVDVDLEDTVFAVTAAVVGFEVLGRRDAAWSSPRVLDGYWQIMLPRLSGKPPGQAVPGPCPATAPAPRKPPTVVVKPAGSSSHG
ncbi:TetR/AcrR family transcriptional regulator [Streptomyces sp. NA04227]|uniref:ScbR family autoregulator-binding transcription factor n=1 Tax=Streptomyces sp. NA04227 TaxID=2742136 RepID=UPI001591C1F7|nr:ScbR family autoregulator-binding transcription factor [Streptomyces sp. NA04227]QKW09798.1 TetR/AcrR family transcriptional regulator [Streptomyces sp. NA04227]